MNNYLKKYLGCHHLGASVDGVISIYAEPSQFLMGRGLEMQVI